MRRITNLDEYYISYNKNNDVKGAVMVGERNRYDLKKKNPQKIAGLENERLGILFAKMMNNQDKRKRKC